MELRVGQTLAGKYELLGELGRGAMCSVWRARQRDLDRLVAVKVPGEGTFATQGGLERFFGEARNAARLHHPNVVALYEVVDEGTPPFLVMEYVAGGDLARLLEQGLALPRLLALLAQVARALESAHGAGIVHRDLKPANVLVTVEGVAKVADWGLAKARDDDRGLTATGMAVGTPRYMAPEQVSGRSATGASDLYALGIVVFEAVWRAAARGGRDPLANHYFAPVPRLDEAVPGTPRELADLVAELLDKEPARRPSSAGALAARLDGLARQLGGRAVAASTEPGPARPPGPSPRPRRAPLLVVCLAVVAALGVAAHRRSRLEPTAPPAPLAVVVGITLDDVDQLTVRGSGPPPPVVRLTLVERGSSVRSLEPATAAATPDRRVAGAWQARFEVPFALSAPALAAVSLAAGLSVEVDPAPALARLWEPVDGLAGERLVALLKDLERLAAHGAPRADLAERLEREGLGRATLERLGRLLPKVLGPWTPAWAPAAARAMPLRLLESVLAVRAPEVLPFAPVDRLLGVEFPGSADLAPPPGCRSVLLAKRLRFNYRRASGETLSLTAKKWVPFDAETRARIKDQLIIGTIESLTMEAPARVAFSVVEASLAGARDAFVQLSLAGFNREHVLVLALNGGPDVVVPCTRSLPGAPVSGYGDRTRKLLLRVDPAWLRPGANELRLSCRVLPSTLPTVCFAFRSLMLYVRTDQGAVPR